MDDVFINSMSYYVPKGRISNSEIIDWFREENQDSFDKEQLDDISYGCQRKLEFLGSEYRSHCLENIGESSTSMAIKTATEAMDKSGLSPDEIDLLIFSAVSNPFREPSYSIFLAAQLGIKNGDFFDINDTCNGFLKSMELASLYIKSGTYNNALIITSEAPYELSKKIKPVLKVDNEKDVDNIISYLFLGSGSAAMVLSNTGEQRKIINYHQEKNSKDWDATIFINPSIKIPETRFGKNNSRILADGRHISSTIIKEMPKFIDNGLKKMHIGPDSIDFAFIHQLGDNITFATIDKIGLSRDKLPINTFRNFGNLACANIPVCLGIAEENDLLKPGNSVLLFSSSCGISYSMAHIKW